MANGKKVPIDSIGGTKKVTRPKINVDDTQYKIKIEKPNRDKRLAIRRLKIKKYFLLCAIALAVIISTIALIGTSSAYKLYKLYRGCLGTSYIIGFQNSAELRPTGGFWGSFAFVEIPDSIQKTQIIFETNPYKKSNEVEKEADVVLPEPMQQIWEGKSQSFVNANWPPDFPESAKTIQWYFGQGWDRSSNGVVAVSSLSVIDLLKLTGPIEMEDRTLITSDNFSQIMSQKIDTEYWFQDENHLINEPKTIIKDLFPIIIQKAKKVPPLKMFKFLRDQLKSNRIMVYLNDSKDQSIIKELGMSGEILPYEVDYLYVNSANLAGEKTSLNVTQNVKYSIESENDTYTGQLEITRSHIANTWPTHPNRNYTRVFVPQGSKIVSARLGEQDILNQIDQSEEYGRNVFGFWFSTDPGQTLTAEVTYELPFKLKSTRDYEITIQKQPGTLPEDIELNLPNKKIIRHQFDEAKLEL